jgi:hypothetical protein
VLAVRTFVRLGVKKHASIKLDPSSGKGSELAFDRLAVMSRRVDGLAGRLLR